MPAYGTSRTIRTAVLPYDGVMRHPLTEGHTGLPEMDCPLITSEHFSRISREESHDFNRGRSQIIIPVGSNCPVSDVTVSKIIKIIDDDSVSLTAFNEKYEIVSQKGKIYVVREK